MIASIFFSYTYVLLGVSFDFVSHMFYRQGTSGAKGFGKAA